MSKEIRKMRKLVLRFAAVFGLVLTVAGCGDAVTLPGGSGPAPDVTTVAPSASESTSGTCCDEVIVIVPRCDPYMELDWCKDEGGECMSSQSETGGEEYQGTMTCPGEGGGGGYKPPPGSEPKPCPDYGCPPAEPEPADTCNTGDAIVDDPEVSAGLSSLWQQSNPDDHLWNRAEKAGWIVEYPAGQFSIVQWSGGTERFGCGDYPALALPTQGTVVGFVHTHPYAVGEAITDCDLASVQTYDGTPSDFDRKAGEILGATLGRQAPLPGYIIDKDGYYRFDGQLNKATPRRARCGY
jgi:hypothetical protein